MKDLPSIEDAPCGYWSFNQDSLVENMNQFMLKELEFQQVEVIGQPVTNFLTLPSRIFYQTHFYPLLRLKGHLQEIYLTLRAKSGKEVPVLVNAHIRQENDETLYECVCMAIRQRNQYEEELRIARKTAQDALASNSELQKVQQKLEQNQRVLDQQISRLQQKNHDLEQFNKIVTHDLREPIRKIILFSDLLTKRPAEEQAGLLEKIYQMCQRMKELLSSLQEYITLDTMELKLTEVDLNLVLERAKKLLTSQGYLPFPVTWSVSPLPKIEGDAEELFLLFYHLMRYSMLTLEEPDKESATIFIEYTPIQKNSFKVVEDKYRYVDFIQLTYSYKGESLPAYELEKLFSLQTRLHKTTIDSGYGLVLCKKIAEKHEGSIGIQVSSTGTVKFTLLLPFKHITHN